MINEIKPLFLNIFSWFQVSNVYLWDLESKILLKVFEEGKEVNRNLGSFD